MTLTKLVAAILLCIDAIMGARFFLNVIHVLGTSKYSKTATIIYAILFLGLAVTGFYFLFIQPNTRVALWLSIGPWALITLGLLINMLTGDYK